MTAAHAWLLFGLGLSIPAGLGLLAALAGMSGGILARRGEAAEGGTPCSCPWCDDIPGADEACALTLPRPLEHIPARPDPDLIDREREMAGTMAARLAGRLDLRSTR